jgi:hypothetical protein
VREACAQAPQVCTKRKSNFLFPSTLCVDRQLAAKKSFSKFFISPLKFYREEEEEFEGGKKRNKSCVGGGQSFKSFFFRFYVSFNNNR